jgi:hypothetical protein
MHHLRYTIPYIPFTTHYSINVVNNKIGINKTLLLLNKGVHTLLYIL